MYSTVAGDKNRQRESGPVYDMPTSIVHFDNGVSTRVDIRQLWICVSDCAVDPNGVTIRQIIVVAAEEKRSVAIRDFDAVVPTNRSNR